MSKSMKKCLANRLQWIGIAVDYWMLKRCHGNWLRWTSIVDTVVALCSYLLCTVCGILLTTIIV